MAVKYLTPLLDDRARMVANGSKEATRSSIYRYRRCDFAYRYVCLLGGLKPSFALTPEERDKEIDHLKRKVDAGAHYICTQLFFENRDFYDFRDRCELAGIRVPILAGIMPVSSRSGMTRMAELALGARCPARLLKAVDRCSDDQSIARVGIEVEKTLGSPQDIEGAVTGGRFHVVQTRPQVGLGTKGAGG